MFDTILASTPREVENNALVRLLAQWKRHPTSSGGLVMRKKRRCNLSSDEISRIANMYSRGLFIGQIAGTFNISKSTIRNLIQEGKVSKRPPAYFRTINTETIDQIIAMYLEGEKIVYIAYTLKIGVTSVHRVITKQNIKRNRRRK